MSAPTEIAYPFVPRLGNLDRTQPVGPMLVQELEHRVRELKDAEGRLQWEATEGVFDPQMRINTCPTSQGVTRCGWPIISIEMVLPHAPRRVVKFFQDMNAQRSRAINAHLTQLDEIEFLVADGIVVSEPLKSVLANPTTARNTPVDWCSTYKKVVYTYTAAESLSPDMQLPPIDSVDLMAVRPNSLDDPNTWLMLAMSVYHDSHRPSLAARRLELYGAYTQFEPVQVQQGEGGAAVVTHTRVTYRSCLKVTDADYGSFTYIRLKEECDRLAASRAALSKL
jgi:hypothetical protein